ncbi:hypothetical protein B0I35DRAFT_109688 [Stachybotrys elegans]|uniref:Zn(2)-C6 fungal-type domain-containing protein n=1 Tax=Stachybotrys elegans TaxID=80388 RepID=A0A8K0SH94_9HYPO|nr:hypothetical protein B0I35DRAFT_109688 [Stachybotrys elegans]
MTDPSSTAFARSRQKNCNQCVLVKRRCDRQTPVCGRCVEKSLVCSWSRNRKVVGQPRHDTSGQPFAFTGSPMLEVPTSHVLSSAQPPNFDYLEDTDLGAATAPTLPAEDYLMGDLVEDGLHTDPFLEMLCKSLHPTQEQWMVSVGAGAPTERPSTPVDEEIMRSYAKIAPSCIDMQPWHLYDPNTPLYYISHRVKGFVSDIASRNAAPFLHHKLYRSQTPPCILTCFTVAVLYTNRTQTNTMMVMQAIHQNADTLVGSEASRPSATPVEKLARTQALFVYQIIQLMDGDVSLRVKGERNLPLLQKWLEELCTVRENLRDLAPMDNLLIRQQPPQEWERWIFAESVRRTIITGLSFLKLYELMKAPKEEGMRSLNSMHSPRF